MKQLSKKLVSASALALLALPNIMGTHHVLADTPEVGAPAAYVSGDPADSGMAPSKYIGSAVAGDPATASASGTSTGAIQFISHSGGAVLFLDQVPNFDFGTHNANESGTFNLIDVNKTSGGNTKDNWDGTGYYPDLSSGDNDTPDTQKVAGARSLVVSDDRENASGYFVSLKLSAFTLSSDTSKTMSGSATFINIAKTPVRATKGDSFATFWGTATTGNGALPNGHNVGDQVAIYPGLIGSQIHSDAGKPDDKTTDPRPMTTNANLKARVNAPEGVGTIGDNIVAGADTATNIFQAKPASGTGDTAVAAEGSGTWIYDFTQDKSVQLSFPIASQSIGTWTATLTWTVTTGAIPGA